MSEGSLPPTPKRLEKARREGDFGASGSLGAALSLLAAVLVLPTFALVVAEDFRDGIKAAIGFGALDEPAHPACDVLRRSEDSHLTGR